MLDQKDGYATLKIGIETLRELRYLVEDSYAQLGEHTTYSVESIEEFLKMTVELGGRG